MENNLFKKKVILIIFFSLILLTNTINAFSFQKIVWAYWNSQIQQAPLVVQLCHQKIQRISKENGYKFIYLHAHNLRYYISNYESEFLKALNNSQRKSSQADSDLIRITIIQQYGGIYFDISTIIFNKFDLKWLQNLDYYNNLIINKYSNTPDVLLFTYCNYQSSLNQRSNDGFLINQNPGFEIWFIAAKQNSQLMKDWKKNYFNFTQSGKHFYSKLLSENNIFIRNVDIGGSYWSANLALYYTLQMKQQQLDKKITFNSLLLPRQSTYEYYKTWGIQGQHGPLSFTRSSLIKQENIFQETLQQLQIRTGQLKFFLKMNSIFRKSINHDLIELGKLYKYGNFDFDEYLKNQPYSQDCHRVKFITEGSLIDTQLILNSNIAKQFNLKGITLVQRQKWNNYCSQYTSRQPVQYNFYEFMTKEFPIGQYAKVQQIKNWKQNQTLSEMTMNFFKYNKFTQWYIGFFALLIIFLVIIVLVSYKVTYKFYYCYDIQPNQSFHISQMNPQIQTQKSLKYLQCVLLVIVRFLQLIFGMLLFYQLQVFNYTPKIEITFVYILLSLIIDRYIKINKQSEIQSYYCISFPINKLIVIFELPINYFLCYSILCTIENRTQYIIFHSVIISLIGSSIRSMGLRIIDRTKQVNRLLKILIFHEGYYKNILLLIYSIIVFIPNFKYYTFGDYYMVEYFVYFPLLYVGLLFIGMFYQLSKQKMNLQVYTKTKILFIILLGAGLLSFLSFYKILYVKTWQIIKYQLSLLSAFSYLYLMCNSQIRQNQQKLNNNINNNNTYINNGRKLLNQQNICLYGLLVMYFMLGTYYFSYQILQFLSQFEAILFTVNVGFYLAYQQIFICKKQPIYQKIYKNEEIQITLPI